MDDLILKAAIWQDDHWADRSGMLKDGNCRTSDLSGQAVKVMLLSLDRNCELHLPFGILFLSVGLLYSASESPVEAASSRKPE
jgi:hypothetical protein